MLAPYRDKEVKRNEVKLTLQNVQANTAQSVDIWVVDFGQESDLWWRHGIVVWEEELEVENPA